MLLALAVPAALAMGFMSADSVIALSDDGRSALVERASAGPEGGGMDDWLVLGDDGFAATFATSNDASPGNGETPERISVSDCEKAVRELGDVLSARGFTGVHVEASACRKERGGVVQIDSGHRAGPGGARLAGEHTADLVVDGCKPYALHAEADDLAVYASAVPRLVLVVESTESGRSIAQTLVVRDGAIVPVGAPP